MTSVPDPSDLPVATKPKTKRWPWVLGGVVAIGALATTLVLVLLGNERGEGGRQTASQSKSTASPCQSPTLKPPCWGSGGWILADGTYESTTRQSAPAYVAPTTTSTAPPLTAADFVLELKTYSKQCFGSAGCNLVVEPAVTYKGTAETMASYGMCSMTYDISGDESGTVTDTLTFIGTSVTASRSILSTPSSKTKVSVKIVSISCN